MPQQRTPGPPRQEMLNIITFGEPQESTSVRAIRSHAAKAGWKSRKNSRGKTFAAAAKNPLLGPTSEAAPAAAQLASSRHKNSPAIPSRPEHAIAHSIVQPLESHDSSSSPSTNASDSTSSSVDSPHDTATGSITDDTGFAKFEINDDKGDLENGNSHAFQLIAREPLRSRFTSILHPGQLGSTHDPFSQFPVRWEESFGPLIHFCKHSSPNSLSRGAKSTCCRLKLYFMVKSLLLMTNLFHLQIATILVKRGWA